MYPVGHTLDICSTEGVTVTGVIALCHRALLAYYIFRAQYYKYLVQVWYLVQSPVGHMSWVLELSYTYAIWPYLVPGTTACSECEQKAFKPTRTKALHTWYLSM